MSIARGVALIVLLAGLALVKIHLQAEQMKLETSIQTLRAGRTDLRHQSWALQLELARLRAPDRIRDRTQRWQLEVRAPWPMKLAEIEGSRLVKR